MSGVQQFNGIFIYSYPHKFSSESESVDAEILVVSSALWDHFTLIRYPSFEAYVKLFRTDEFIAAGSLRCCALEDMIAFASSEGGE